MLQSGIVFKKVIELAGSVAARLRRLRLCRSLKPFSVQEFAEWHAVRRLYESSRLHGDHASGAQSVTAVVSYVQGLDIGLAGERLSAALMVQRLEKIRAWSNQVVGALPQVDAIIFFGSALRGRVTPNDFDFFLVVPAPGPQPSESGLIEVEQIEKTVEAAFNRLDPHFHRAAGFPVEVRCHALYDERPIHAVSFVERCPYLVLGKPDDNGRNPIFFNCSGTDYLTARKA